MGKSISIPGGLAGTPSRLIAALAICGLASLAPSLAPALAQDEASATTTAQDAHRLELTTEKVIVFKDGHCLVIKRGKATTDDDGRVYTDAVPDSAVLGSFWATAECDRNNRVRSPRRPQERNNMQKTP